MVKITPALLTPDLETFEAVLLEYALLPVEQIDIDFCEAQFVGNDTVPIDEGLEVISRYLELPCLGFHLMYASPEQAVKKIIQTMGDRMAKIYIHAEADYEFALSDNYNLANFGLVLKLETPVPEISLLENFSEIQLMTIQAGKQGNIFQPSMLDKVKGIRDKGFRGGISLDGGINMESVDYLKEVDIQRLSVGSYLQKSADKQVAYRQLFDKLNN